jgi:ABC-type transport system substrate-binding protein
LATNYWHNVTERRISRRRALAATGGLAASAAFLAACGGGGEDGGGGQSSSDLVVQIKDETKDVRRGGIYKSVLGAVPTFDPHLQGNHVTHVWMNYSQLLKTKPGNVERSDGSVEGEIMASWEISPDKLTITGKLTDKAHFTPKAPLNGRSVTMDDVMFSWNRYKSISPRRSELAADANPNAPIVSMTAVDASTLVITLNKPVATILSSLTGGVPGTLYIAPKEAENTSVLDLKGTLAGSGPWFLEDWVPSSRITFRKNPGFGQDSRGVPFMDGVDFTDLNEYATILAQFKSGQFHDTFNNFLPEDILQTKSDIPALEVHSPGLTFANDRAFFGFNQDSPFRDERLRQAMVMTWDRDLFIETAFNTRKFQDAGLPVQTMYDNGLRGVTFAGWFLDPKSKEFGENSKYFVYNPDEAKKLQQAAGYGSGVDYTQSFGTIARHTASFGQHLDILIGMARDSLLWRPRINEIDYDTEWNTNFRNNKGRFSGMAFIFDTGESDPANDLYSHYHPAGSRYFGPEGGDKTMSDMLDKMVAEFDNKKRQDLAHDVLRYEGGRMFQPRPGGASGFRITWPALRNKDVWRDENQGRYLSTLWLDQTKRPFVA